MLKAPSKHLLFIRGRNTTQMYVKLWLYVHAVGFLGSLSTYLLFLIVLLSTYAFLIKCMYAYKIIFFK